MTTLTAGFIGLGNQGLPIARRIAGAGFPLRIWARRAASLAPLADTPAIADDTPAALAAACDLIGICVVNDDDVREVLLTHGLLAAMRPGAIVAIHATLLPDTVIALDTTARAHGVHLLDAPVSGGAHGATAGTMTVMVGGDPEPLARARPVFESFATTIAHLGPVGSGQMLKLLNNNLAYANLTMAINALELAARLGIDPAVAAPIIKASSGASVGLNILTDPTLFAKIGGLDSNLVKDVHHLTEVAARLGLADAELLAVSNTTSARIRHYVASAAPRI